VPFLAQLARAPSNPEIVGRTAKIRLGDFPPAYVIDEFLFLRQVEELPNTLKPNICAEDGLSIRSRLFPNARVETEQHVNNVVPPEMGLRFCAHIAVLCIQIMLPAKHSQRVVERQMGIGTFCIQISDIAI